MQISLDGMRVLVTGGGAGIGWKTAEAFMASGARIHICDLSPENLAKFSAAHPKAGATLTDVADHQAVDRLFEQARAETDEARRLQLHTQAATQIADDAPWLFLYQDRLPRVVSRKLTGVVPARSVFIDYTRLVSR